MGIVSILILKLQSPKDYLSSRGIDQNRLVVVNVVTIEEFRSKALRAVDIYLEDRRRESQTLYVRVGFSWYALNRERNY